MGVLKCTQEHKANRAVADCNKFLEKYYMMLQFGGRNPGFGVNHVYPCIMCLDVCFLYYVCTILFHVPGCSRLIPFIVMM